MLVTTPLRSYCFRFASTSLGKSNLLAATPSVSRKALNQSWIPRSFTTSCCSYIQFIDMPKQVPSPTETVADVETFLKKIGRNTIEFAQHFDSWEKLMTISSQEMKEKGIDTRQRRYILAQREKFRRGVEPKEIKRGKKSWGGERRRKANRAAYYGRQRAEERAKLQKNSQ